MGRTIDVTTSWAASALFGGAGVFAKGAKKKPEKPLELYEYEACPFCRKARVALTSLDLDAMIYPCPRNGPRYRSLVKERGGKAQFPYLVDPNSGREMYESDAIVSYLASEYGGARPLSVAMGPVSSLLSALSSAPRAGRGRFYRSARAPEQPLELYSFEGSPYCRLVREALCELEIPYLLHNVGKGSPKRAAFVERSGKMMVPYLIDPNTGYDGASGRASAPSAPNPGREMFESADIVRYLDETYAL